MTKNELRRKWKIWGNGAIHAAVDAVVFGGAGAFGAFSGAISWTAAGLILLTAIGAGLRGYYKNSPLPDLFVVEEETILPSGSVVTKTTTVSGSTGMATEALQEAAEVKRVESI